MALNVFRHKPRLRSEILDDGGHEELINPVGASGGTFDHPASAASPPTSTSTSRYANGSSSSSKYSPRRGRGRGEHRDISHHGEHRDGARRSEQRSSSRLHRGEQRGSGSGGAHHGADEIPFRLPLRPTTPGYRVHDYSKSAETPLLTQFAGKSDIRTCFGIGGQQAYSVWRALIAFLQFAAVFAASYFWTAFLRVPMCGVMFGCGCTWSWWGGDAGCSFWIDRSKLPSHQQWQRWRSSDGVTVSGNDVSSSSNDDVTVGWHDVTGSVNDVTVSGHDVTAAGYYPPCPWSTFTKHQWTQTWLVAGIMTCVYLLLWESPWSKKRRKSMSIFWWLFLTLIAMTLAWFTTTVLVGYAYKQVYDYPTFFSTTRHFSHGDT